MGKRNNAMCGYLERPDKFADFINGSLYHGREVLRPERLEERQTVYSGTGRTRDILRMVCGKQSYLLIGIEAQDQIDFSMPIRCMDYDVQEYRKQLKRFRTKYRKMKERQGTDVSLSSAEFLSGMKKEDRLNPVITIVFYHGTEKYDGCRTLHDMLSFGKENEIFRPYISDYHMNLITLEDLREENFRTGVRELVGILKRSVNKKDLQKYCMDHAERIRKMDEDTFDAVSVLINQPDFLKRKGNYREGDRINMCKAMEDWREDILKEGIEQGIEQGIRILILDYLEEGIAETRIKEKLQKRFLLDGETAQGYLKKYAGGNA